MARYSRVSRLVVPPLRVALPIVAEVAGYILVTTGAFLVDLRLGLAVVGLALLYEAREARP